MPPKKIYPIKNFISTLSTKSIFKTPSPNNPAVQAGAPSGDEAADTNTNNGGRIIIIGDVHGMKSSLDTLLSKVNFNPSKDHLIFVGDLVNKGPDSPGVVELAMRLDASAVRGNHENAVLHAAKQIEGRLGDLIREGFLKEVDAEGENLEDMPFGTLVAEMQSFQKYIASAEDEVEHSAATYITALALSSRQLEWLKGLPLILKVELPPTTTIPTATADPTNEEESSPSSPFEDSENLVVVHAGLIPGIPLEDQDPYSIMHMRSFNHGEEKSELLATEEFGEEGWVKEWDLWQDKCTATTAGGTGKTTVVFGHDAKRRLQVGKYFIGLDSACLYGHRLSALVISEARGRMVKEVVQIDCSDEPVVPTQNPAQNPAQTETETGKEKVEGSGA